MSAGTAWDRVSGSILVCALFLSCSCRPKVEPAGPHHQINCGVAPEWGQFAAGEGLQLRFWVQNVDRVPVEFQFRDSGRVCAVMRDLNGHQIYSFPEKTAPGLRLQKLEPIEQSWQFTEFISSEKFAEARPGKHVVEAWLCGYETLRDSAEFWIPNPAWKSLEYRLAADWDATVPGGQLVLGYTIKNNGRHRLRFEFPNSGRICGVVWSLSDEELYRFPQVTTQVVGAEILGAGKELKFRHTIPRREIIPTWQRTHTIEAWLCGYDYLRARRQLVFPSQ